MSHFQKIGLLIWFYIGWFGCVYFAKWGLSGWSFIFPLVPWVNLLILNIFTQRQIFYLLFLALFGILFDFFAYQLNWIAFPDFNSPYIPYWLLALWFLFVSIFPLSHSFFKSKLKLATLLGAVFGPLSYYWGEAFHVLSFNNHISIFIYALFWGIYFPAALYFYPDPYGPKDLNK